MKPLILVILLLSAVTVFADKAQTKKVKLKDKENPEKIGKRDINNNQINFYSLEREIAIGQQLAAETERQLKLIDDPVVTEYINRLGQNIALNSDAKVPFTIKVIDSEEVNAFALPGGYFFVNKGLILAADTEAELVGVMAHEIAHVAARHGTEQVSKGQLLEFGSIPLIFLGGGIGVLARTAASFAIPLTFLKFSRGAESEADMLGAQYAWASGYDPNGMIMMFEKLQQKESKKPGTMSKIFSSHPATGDRAIALRALIAKFPEKEEYIITSSDFQKVKNRLLAFSGPRRSLLAGDEQPTEGRPTLRRRRDSDIDNPDYEDTQPKERPTLRRRGDSPLDTQEQQDNTDSTPVEPSRPTLKRSGGGGSQ
ncbi:MAG: M48 family metallopeptidase [Acidobacteriota bacterium]|nr:M48 family metallopeptidase [Blastocatellia bacterium]MDW8412120.1 M48 family metallopeptidase [Acidobacteriota bacterium]